MKAYRKLTLVALAGSVLAMLTPNARAEMLGQKIQVTFSNPVELPGTVLPQGTYIFEFFEFPAYDARFERRRIRSFRNLPDNP